MFLIFKSSNLLLRGNNYYYICTCLSFQKRKTSFSSFPASLPISFCLSLLPSFLYGKTCDAILAPNTNNDRAVFLYTLVFKVAQYFKAQMNAYQLCIQLVLSNVLMKPPATQFTLCYQNFTFLHCYHVCTFLLLENTF